MIKILIALDPISFLIDQELDRSKAINLLIDQDLDRLRPINSLIDQEVDRFETIKILIDQLYRFQSPVYKYSLYVFGGEAPKRGRENGGHHLLLLLQLFLLPLLL